MVQLLALAGLVPAQGEPAFLVPKMNAQQAEANPVGIEKVVVWDDATGWDAEFEALYTDFGRPSIAPERLIRASLIQILFSVRSERQLMEQMQYNLPFRWFVGLGIDDPVWGEGRPEICPVDRFQP